jgi:hypothetical protein
MVLREFFCLQMDICEATVNLWLFLDAVVSGDCAKTLRLFSSLTSLNSPLNFCQDQSINSLRLIDITSNLKCPGQF